MGQSPTTPFREGNSPTPGTRQGQASRNGRSRKGDSGKYRPGDDAEARYEAALKLVQVIDRNLQRGTRHYYDTRGRLLSTLDEVVHAMLNNSLAPDKPAKRLPAEEAVQWAPVSELAA
jgi:hypothetical protein